VRAGAPVLLFRDDEIQRAGGVLLDDMARDLAANSIMSVWGMRLFGKHKVSPSFLLSLSLP